MTLTKFQTLLFTCTCGNSLSAFFIERKGELARKSDKVTCEKCAGIWLVKIPELIQSRGAGK